MKKHIIVFLALFSISGLFINTSMPQAYFPLKIGNKFIFHYYHETYFPGGGQHWSTDILGKISKDTIFYGKKYFKIETFGYWGNKWVRIDSITKSLYAFDEANSCPFYYKETLLDSLRIPLDSTENSCSQKTLEYINSIVIWGKNTIRKEFHQMSGGGVTNHNYCEYDSIFGPYYQAISSYHSGVGSSDTYTLKGCVINGIVYGDTNVLNIKKYGSIIPITDLLFQNYPNPFNSVSIIKYHISKTADIKIVIYDISGREQLNVVNERQRGGVYEASFSAGSLSSGVYFYSLFVDGKRVDTRKMVLIK